MNYTVDDKCSLVTSRKISVLQITKVLIPWLFIGVVFITWQQLDLFSDNELYELQGYNNFTATEREQIESTQTIHQTKYLNDTLNQSRSRLNTSGSESHSQPQHIQLSPLETELTFSATESDILQSIDQIFDQIFLVLSESNGQLSSDDLALFREFISQLFNQPDAAILAIHDFFLNGSDIAFSAEFAKQLGQDTLRLAMLDILRRIGGGNALTTAANILKTDVSPQELLALSNHLQMATPGLFQTDLLLAGHKILSQIGTYESSELGPVYQLVAELGGISVDDLQNTPVHHQQYAAVALALLPDGSGIPTLVHNVNQSDLRFNNHQDRLSLRLLAQTASDNETAATTLTELTMQNVIPDSLWPEVAAIVGGLESIQLSETNNRVINRHHISYPAGDQIIYRTRNVNFNDRADIQARLSIIEHLYTITNNEAAVQALTPVLDRLTFLIH